jgi:hypothetical protein
MIITLGFVFFSFFELCPAYAGKEQEHRTATQGSRLRDLLFIMCLNQIRF